MGNTFQTFKATSQRHEHTLFQIHPNSKCRMEGILEFRWTRRGMRRWRRCQPCPGTPSSIVLRSFFEFCTECAIPHPSLCRLTFLAATPVFGDGDRGAAESAWWPHHQNGGEEKTTQMASPTNGTRASDATKGAKLALKNEPEQVAVLVTLIHSEVWHGIIFRPIEPVSNAPVDPVII